MGDAARVQPLREGRAPQRSAANQLFACRAGAPTRRQRCFPHRQRTAARPKPRWTQYFVCARSAIANDSLAQTTRYFNASSFASSSAVVEDKYTTSTLMADKTHS